MKHSGIRPKNYKTVTTVRIINREWTIAVSFDSLPFLVKWKVYLTRGTLPRANYWIMYSVRLNRFCNSTGLQSFMTDFPFELGKLIQDLSVFLIELNKTSLPESEPEANKERET